MIYKPQGICFGLGKLGSVYIKFGYRVREFLSTSMKILQITLLTLATSLYFSGCNTTQTGGQWVELPEGLYYGDVSNSLPHGKGVLKLKGGNLYRGKFKSGYMHGKGVFEWTNGNRYEGNYCEGKRHGKGTYTWANGAEYKGDYKSGLREGKGRLDLPNGKRFTGEFIGGKRHGQGVLKHPDGRIERGLWKDDKIVIQDPN